MHQTALTNREAPLVMRDVMASRLRLQAKNKPKAVLNIL